MTGPSSPGDGRTQRQRMLAGDPYIADGDSKLAAESLRARLLVEEFNRSSAGAAVDRRRILEELPGAFGVGSEIRPPFLRDYGYQIRMRSRSICLSG